MAVVLVLDTDAAARRACRKALEDAGHDVVRASETTDGVERLREGGIDAIVVDAEIAGGFDAFHRALDKLPDPPPFLLVSGRTDGPALSARVGASGFFAKPVPLKELVAWVDRLVVTRPVPGTVEEVPTRPVEKKEPA